MRRASRCMSLGLARSRGRTGHACLAPQRRRPIYGDRLAPCVVFDQFGRMPRHESVLEDVLAVGLRLVICGSAASSASARVGAYYAGPQNRFWATLAEVGLTAERWSPHQFRELLHLGIGLTDIAKSQFGNDDAIRVLAADREALRDRIAEYQPAILCFNGKRPAQQYLQRRSVSLGLQPTSVGRTRLFVAPSTSAAARGHWNLAPWRELALLVRRVST
jgi:double-stranded uracil-DNA glycosylase